MAVGCSLSLCLSLEDGASLVLLLAFLSVQVNRHIRIWAVRRYVAVGAAAVVEARAGAGTTAAALAQIQQAGAGARVRLAIIASTPPVPATMRAN